MKTVAIICEYNPLHMGHIEQIERIRAHFAPEETTIVALMSGNFVQRGEPAVYPKTVRARAAVDAGVNLVLELPFPYCSGGAKYFADSAVSIITRLGVVDHLCFGSECGIIEGLSVCAERLLSGGFEDSIAKKLADRKNISYACARSETYAELYGEPLPTQPNDILGIEYLSALKKNNSNVKPLVIKRVSSYSASAARSAILAGDAGQAAAVLAPTMQKYVAELAPMSMEQLALPLLIHFRTNTAKSLADTAEMTFDLASSIKSAAQSARSISELLSAVGNKTYTDARIRRAMLFSLFGVTKARLLTLPQTVNLLAADKKGRTLLRLASKLSSIPTVSSRPNRSVAESYDFSMNADGIYALICKINTDFYKEKPYIV